MNVKERDSRLTKKRWIVLAACCVANLCIGAIYAWSVFAGPMAEHLNAINGTHKTAADLAIIFSVANGDAFITMIAGGYLEKKIGSKWVILIGTVVFGLGFVISGLFPSMAGLIFGFSLLCGLANGFAYVCTVSNSVKFFPDKKGLVGGISTASFGISSVIIPPIADKLNTAFGVCRAFIIFGVIIAALGVLCSLFIDNCPEDFIPTGWEVPENKETGGGRDLTAGEMLKSPAFYVMLGMLFVGSSLGLMVISEASNIAQSMLSMSAAAAAAVVSALALFNTFGRIAAGWISDRIGRTATIAGVFAAAAAALLCIYISGKNGQTALFCAGICLIGLCYGAFMGVYPGFTSDRFGTKYHTLNYGIMFIGFSLAGFAGPLLMQAVFNGSGSYRPAFLIALIFAAGGLGMTFLYRRMEKKK